LQANLSTAIFLPEGTVQAASKGEKTTQDQQKGLIPSMAAPLRWQGSVDEQRFHAEVQTDPVDRGKLEIPACPIKGWGSATGDHAGTMQTAEQNAATQYQQKGQSPSMVAPRRWQGSVDERRYHVEVQTDPAG
jgi:hypothetical protein